MHFRPHILQIHVLISNCCIIIEHLVKFAQLEEDDFIKILAFYFPELTHRGCEFTPCLLWDIQSCGVVVWVTRASFLGVKTMLFLSPYRCGISKLRKWVLVFMKLVKLLFFDYRLLDLSFLPLFLVPS